MTLSVTVKELWLKIRYQQQECSLYTVENYHIFTHNGSGLFVIGRYCIMPTEVKLFFTRHLAQQKQLKHTAVKQWENFTLKVVP